MSRHRQPGARVVPGRDRRGVQARPVGSFGSIGAAAVRCRRRNSGTRSGRRAPGPRWTARRSRRSRIVGTMNLGCRFEPSRHRRRIVSPIAGLAKRRSTLRLVLEQVDTGTGGTDGMISVVEQPRQEAPIERVAHRLVHEVDVHQRGRVGDRRVAAVEDADLHQLERTHVGDELDADLLERRPPRAEPVLEHPLAERLAEHRPGVVDAVALAQKRALRVRRRRRDAVDHRVGKRDLVARSSAPGPRRPGRASPTTAACVTSPLPGRLSHDITVNGATAAARRRIDAATIGRTPCGGADVRSAAPVALRRPCALPASAAASATMAGCAASKRCVAGIDAVAAFGDGQRHDADRRVGEPREIRPRASPGRGIRSSRR